jgi:hypothetical protein
LPWPVVHEGQASWDGCCFAPVGTKGLRWASRELTKFSGSFSNLPRLFETWLSGVVDDVCLIFRPLASEGLETCWGSFLVDCDAPDSDSLNIVHLSKNISIPDVASLVVDLWEGDKGNNTFAQIV